VLVVTLASCFGCQLLQVCTSIHSSTSCGLLLFYHITMHCNIHDPLYIYSMQIIKKNECRLAYRISFPYNTPISNMYCIPIYSVCYLRVFVLKCWQTNATSMYTPLINVSSFLSYSCVCVCAAQFTSKTALKQYYVYVI
jgi:hypothetical protein